MVLTMTVINYPRHFAGLALGAIAVFVVMRLHENELVLLLLSSFLHAVAVLCALKSEASWARRALFAASAPLLSFAALKAMAAVPSMAPQLAICLVSAVGACTYWCLVRVFWIRTLTLVSLFRAACLCTAVTAAWALAFRRSLFFAIEPWVLTAHTFGWWLGFSFSLYLSERANETKINDTSRVSA
jgi:hypothetical protein